MQQEFEQVHKVDENGFPAGGFTWGRGIDIEWQDGPLAVDGVRNEPNGAFVETLIAMVVGRIEFYQTAADGRFACRENAVAITKLQEAGMWLDKRTRDREARGVEGTHEQ